MRKNKNTLQAAGDKPCEKHPIFLKAKGAAKRVFVLPFFFFTGKIPALSSVFCLFRIYCRRFQSHYFQKHTELKYKK